MHAKTTVMASSDFDRDRIWLNGKEENFDNPRIKSCLAEIRKRLKEEEKSNPEINKKLSWKVHICSNNNFPTAAGLASSAAGYACLVYSLAKVFGVGGELSSIARLGSGSACRSIYGGFVQWIKGEKDDGSDSIAVQLAPPSHWPTFRVLILVTNEKRKKVSSADGMQRSVKTSELLKHRVSYSVPNRVLKITSAINNKDFDSFAEITMKDSNQFHSVCLDTYPPAVYMNDISHAVTRFVHAYNKWKSANKLAYTFDAGPNACLFMEEKDVPEVAAHIKHIFPPSSEDNFFTGIPIKPVKLNKEFNFEEGPLENGTIKYVIHTKVGEGPTMVNDHLLDNKGSPVKID